MNADLILANGRFSTLDREKPRARAVAIAGGRFLAVGDEAEVRALAGADTKTIDLNGRRAIPGLIDSHMHVIRGGLNYNMELRWDGVGFTGRCDGDAQSAGGPHASAAMGPGHRRLHRPSIRRKAAAFARRSMPLCLT